MHVRFFLVFLFFATICQGQRFVENLNRGLIAVRTSPTQVFLSWRLLGTEAESTTFNVYRDGVKLNTSPVVISTNFIDNSGSNAIYTVRAIINNIEQKDSEQAKIWEQAYLDISLKAPAGGTTPDGVAYTYNANDCSVGDVDGDGEYEIILKWDPSNAKDNSQSGYTGNVYLDALKLDGTQLWRIDLGKNIRAGAHYTQFMVYDFDSDGKAEIACKTADGTIDGKGKLIGDEKADYRNKSGYVLSGPEFLTIFNGQTGEAMATTDYLPARGTVESWGDSYGNRVDRYIAAVAYLDGKRPSLIMGRGYYTRLVRAAWDWRDGKLTSRWVFDSDNNNKNYEYQGNHQMTVGDVDGDGKDEIINGSSAIDDDGKGLYENHLGHGDALHMTDMNPDREGQEIWQSHESPSKYGAYGLEFRDAKTGTPLWGVDGENKDIGRALAIDIDPRYKGYECWGSIGGLYDCKGNSIGTARPSMNFAVWWDADLSRELLDGNHIDKWDYLNGKSNRILTATDYSSNNGTKATPSLSADILGDWREEVILRKTDNTSLRIFTTTIPATNRIYTLMHDPQYRVAIAWQNSAYNQPPHPSFYLGDGMNKPPKPNIQLVAKESSQIITGIDENITHKATVFPNPSRHSFQLKMQGKFTYSIITTNGRKVESHSCKDECEIGAKIPTGIYIIQIESAQGNDSLKIVKE
ncbi:T9SS type A sorting domain-containing protein [Arcicella sp. LKC2W]|uniref:rhamnogalacturonan lyase family protein n=1 Tax=Arcicella sp. LKC2W TaxID=2984198 RepID=UPI002B1ED466|nr:T9SS type A sorting domain-containing protein [Arcicella sp. LKC2W]MEA5459466.1 T9SS type A sorting domain-containing protein [Arcicella sp. LKC2W]